MENKAIVGILAVILGILMLIFPFASMTALSVIVSLGILILGVYYLVTGFNLWKVSKWACIFYIIIGIFAILLGMLLFGQVLLFDLFVVFYLYVIGFLMVFGGILGLFSRVVIHDRTSAGITVILGILTIILAAFSLQDPLFIAVIIGVSLIIEGITLIATRSLD
ncbi:DUF308 domain-containing protein [Methanobrevibacter filiformis]|uniref:Acid-resistance membrane protein n=1 Tax=Methanobrevibacter filiformis TaxID=55758 RepID=A0A166CI96_9EURY|nr:DUF308 domain-containing protein [Methanobrevibacter filiformis]KZX14597.1 acid-resistance membrane protein [Methanobrevibacter filiformis]